MVVFTIFVAAIAATFLLSNAISHGFNKINRSLIELNESIGSLNKLINVVSSDNKSSMILNNDIAKSLDSIKKVLARNFRIAMNDNEFEKL